LPLKAWRLPDAEALAPLLAPLLEALAEAFEEESGDINSVSEQRRHVYV
jgi:hypothetical protein